MRTLYLLIFLLLAACGGGSSGSQALPPPPPAPAAPVADVAVGLKQLIFSWEAVSGVLSYKLLENPDGVSGFTQVGDNLSATSLSVRLPISVHLQDFANAMYIVQACNAGGCTDSTEVNATDVMLDTIGTIQASNAHQDSFFGRSVSLSADGRTLAVGSHWEEGGSSGINGDQNIDEHQEHQIGAAYLLRFDGTDWIQQAYIKASNPNDQDVFGSNVTLSADGNSLAVWAPGESSAAAGINADQSDNSLKSSSAVYLFRFDGVEWSQTAYIKSPYPEEQGGFGRLMSISGDGNVLVINDYGEGGSAVDDNSAVYIYRFDGTDWNQTAVIDSASTNGSGKIGSGYLSTDGNLLAVTGFDNAMFRFQFDGANWMLQENVSTVQRGRELEFSGDLNTLATGWDEVSVYRFDSASWNLEDTVTPAITEAGDCLGCSLSLSLDGDTFVMGAHLEDSSASGVNGDPMNNLAQWSGAAYVFRFDGSTWVEEAYVKSPNNHEIPFPDPIFGAWFGSSVALSADGKTLAVGADGQAIGSIGAVFVY